jgi:hypothetical protein
LVFITQEVEQVDGYKGGPDLVTELVRNTTHYVRTG